jgi:integrase
VSHTTRTHSPVPRGIRVATKGRSYEVRVRPFPPRAGFPLTAGGLDEAIGYLAELKRRRRLGVLVPPEHDRTDVLLRDATLEYLERLETFGGDRDQRPYTPQGLAQARKECRSWLGEPLAPYFTKGGTVTPPEPVDERGIPFGSLPLTALRVRSLETYLERRAQRTRRAAVGEQQRLRSILLLAGRRGYAFDHALLTLMPMKRNSRRREGLPLDQLRFLAAHAPEHQRRVFLLGATLGLRIMELLRCEDAWVDLEAGTLTIPAWAHKSGHSSGEAKVLDLLPEEVVLIREQRLLRSPNTVCGRDGSPLLFPRRHGTRWTHAAWWDDVVQKVRRKAAKAWRVEHGTSLDAPTPFCDWQPHDLRRGATDLLTELGVEDALIAARLGHADQGELVRRRYAKDARRERLQAALDEIAAAGGIDACLALLEGKGR